MQQPTKPTVQATKRNRGQVPNPEMPPLPSVPIGLPLPPAPNTPVMVTKRKAPRVLKETEQPTIKLITLKKLPGVLSSWIEGEKPKVICQIESPETGTGFNTIAWQDQRGSRLYLENLDPFHPVNPSFLRGTLYPNVLRLAEESGWQNSLPDTIFVKSAGGSKSRMAAKKMVLELLYFYQGFQLPNKPILKETKTDLSVGGGFVITFSVKGITQIQPIMGPDTFRDKYSHVVSDSLAKTLVNALDSYQQKLEAVVVNGFRVEEERYVAEAIKMFQGIKGAAQKLLSTVETEIENKKQTTPIGTELAVLNRLQYQVESAIANVFRNELDTRRWQQWLTLNPQQWHMPKPLTEDQIVPGTGKEIGEGARGPVFKYELDTALGIWPVVLKYDSNRLNDDAKGAGIPELNPQQSVRAVAAFKMSEHLQLGVIPQTEFFVGTDDDGRPKLGQAMEVVNGTVGQRKAGLKDNAAVDQQEIQALEDAVNTPGKHDPEDRAKAQRRLVQYVKVNGQWYKAEIFPVNIDYGNPVVQKGLSDLQVFDCIIGHADRNPGNWIYEKKGGKIIGVKGIDNDDTFGKDWLPFNPVATMRIARGSKTPGIPPIVDISTALSILNADFKAIRPLLAGLSDEEITTAGQRFKQVQQEVVQRVREGKIASIGDEGVQDKLEQLRILTNMEAKPGIRRWGDEVANVHNEQNSYLGYPLAEKDRLAKQYQVGVVPESGDVLV